MLALVKTETEIWLVERAGGEWVLMLPVWGYGMTEIRIKHAAGGQVTVVPAGATIQVGWKTSQWEGGGHGEESLQEPAIRSEA